MVANIPHTSSLLRIVTHGSAANPHHTGQGATGSSTQQQAAPPTNSFPPGSQHTGTVTAQGSNGLHTLSFANGQTLQVQASQPFPVGTQMQVQITADGHIQILNMNIPASTQHQQALAQFSAGWSTLTQALKALKENNPTAGKELAGKLPHIGKNFLPAMLMFSNAVGENMLEKLFGKDIMDLFNRLGFDFTGDSAALHRLSQQPEDPNSWRTLFFPYLENDGEEPNQGSFFWRKQKSGEHEDTRFVINLSLTNLGATQLDGLMHDRSLYMKMRLQKEPPAGFAEGLETVYAEILDKLELQGSITVEITSYFDVDPAHEMLQSQKQFNVTA